MNIDFKAHIFGPVLDLPPNLPVFDFSKGYDPARSVDTPYGIGRYGEHRPGMYSTELFTKDARSIHVGIDLAAPVGSEVRAVYEGHVYLTAINPAAGDYGGTVITQHSLDGCDLWILHGHLSHASVSYRTAGDRIARGDVIGWLGSREENGGWNPHLHFQLSLKRPRVCDLPGAVNEESLAEALKIYPDPRLVLGWLYGK